MFKYFFTNKAYLPSDLPGKLFSTLHIIVMIILCITVPLTAFLLRKMDKKKMKTLFIVLWGTMSGLEIAKIIWESCTNPNGFEVTGILPLYICSIFMYVMPFAIWGKEHGLLRKSACSFLCTINLIGGLVNFIYPSNVLSNYSVVSFAGLHTLLYHGTMVFVALLMLFSKYYTFSNIKDAILAFIPLAIVSIPANIINFTYNCSYMFFRGGFPFSLISDHMPEWLWVIVLYLAYALIPFLFYLPSFIHQKIKARKQQNVNTL
ncbi:MAG: YwaF family protein [Clostridia bacterium]|nr:YwaF family protein [Clostridia bacterium]MBQ8792839.1 YwaF family protein [Clostridia bacterium]